MALNKALKERRYNQVKHLLGLQVNVNSRDHHLKTPLMEISSVRNADVCLSLAERFLVLGADLDSKDAQGCTALMHACQQGNTKLVELFLSWSGNFDMNAQDDDGRTALFYATRRGSVLIVERLIKAMRDLSLSVDVADTNGFTPLLIASKLGHERCAELLISKGKASIHRRDNVLFKNATEWKEYGEHQLSESSTQSRPKRMRNTVYRQNGMPRCFTGISLREREYSDHTRSSQASSTESSLPELDARSKDTNSTESDAGSHRHALSKLYDLYGQQASESFRSGSKDDPNGFKSYDELKRHLESKRSQRFTTSPAPSRLRLLRIQSQDDEKSIPDSEATSNNSPLLKTHAMKAWRKRLLPLRIVRALQNGIKSTTT